MFASITAVELDRRLVEKCQRNIELNQCQEFVEVILNDAALWAKRNTSACFDVMLVDPPRQGLAKDVCRLAVEVLPCENILYISCGYEALIRDLEVLSSAFDVIDCTVVDLFPRMEGVESLVHLRRRTQQLGQV
jgi:tRNA/tmRNA/rRNA uracil-C5-methylase (TrmA/RlmC/RlmD family)